MPKVMSGYKDYLDHIKKMTPFERLVYWIKEREEIRLKKENGWPLPWTEDPILRTYRFCNVVRMEDKVSKWLLNHWYKPYFDHHNMLVACTLARHFNNPGALQYITAQVFGEKQGIPNYKPDVIKKTLRHVKENGQTVFSGAYMIHGVGTMDKIGMVVDMVCQPLIDNPPVLNTNSVQECVETLVEGYWGFSSFLAGQVVADLVWAIKGTWTDKHTWAPVGPGSRKGMYRLLEQYSPMKQEEFTGHLNNLITKLKEVLPRELSDRMVAQDTQSTLCEFDKYERTLLGEGKPKQKYNGMHTL